MQRTLAVNGYSAAIDNTPQPAVRGTNDRFARLDHRTAAHAHAFERIERQRQRPLATEPHHLAMDTVRVAVGDLEPRAHAHLPHGTRDLHKQSLKRGNPPEKLDFADFLYLGGKPAQALRSAPGASFRNGMGFIRNHSFTSLENTVPENLRAGKPRLPNQRR